jgi:hypothetical protein
VEDALLIIDLGHLSFGSEQKFHSLKK